MNNLEFLIKLLLLIIDIIYFIIEIVKHFTTLW